MATGGPRPGPLGPSAHGPMGRWARARVQGRLQAVGPWTCSRPWPAPRAQEVGKHVELAARCAATRACAFWGAMQCARAGGDTWPGQVILETSLRCVPRTRLVDAQRRANCVPCPPSGEQCRRPAIRLDMDMCDLPRCDCRYAAAHGHAETPNEPLRDPTPSLGDGEHCRG